VKYGKSWTFKSKKIKRCIAIKVTGSISYTERVESAPHSPVQTFHWQHQTLRSRRSRSESSDSSRTAAAALPRGW
jgi:hypothetical protein